jgi:hypothetical protein
MNGVKNKEINKQNKEEMLRRAKIGTPNATFLEGQSGAGAGEGCLSRRGPLN